MSLLSFSMKERMAEGDYQKFRTRFLRDREEDQGLKTKTKHHPGLSFMAPTTARFVSSLLCSLVY